MNTDNIPVLDTISADSIEVGDQVVIEGDYVEVVSIAHTSDIDEIVVSGFSHITGDSETYSLYADDNYDIWGV